MAVLIPVEQVETFRVAKVVKGQVEGETLFKMPHGTARYFFRTALMAIRHKTPIDKVGMIKLLREIHKTECGLTLGLRDAKIIVERYVQNLNNLLVCLPDFLKPEFDAVCNLGPFDPSRSGLLVSDLNNPSVLCR